jgi:hypothetical protein
VTCSHINNDNLKFVPLENPRIYLNLLIAWKRNRYLSYASREWIRFTSETLDIRLEL